MGYQSRDRRDHAELMARIDALETRLDEIERAGAREASAARGYFDIAAGIAMFGLAVAVLAMAPTFAWNWGPGLFVTIGSVTLLVKGFKSMDEGLSAD